MKLAAWSVLPLAVAGFAWISYAAILAVLASRYPRTSVVGAVALLALMVA